MIIKNNKVLVEKRKANDDFGADAVWISGGHVEKEKEPFQALKCELMEELNVKLEKSEFICELSWNKNGKKHTIYYYFTRKFKGKIKNQEVAKLFFMNPNKLTEDVDNFAAKLTIKYVK